METAKAVAELPPEFYRYLGYIIYAQVGLIVVILGWIFKFGMFVSETILEDYQ